MSSMACNDLRLTPMQRAKKHHQHGIYTSIRSVMRSLRESARRFVLHLSFAVSKRGTERRVSGRQRTEAKTQTGKAGSTPFFSRSKKTHTLCGTFLNVCAYFCICVVVYDKFCFCKNNKRTIDRVYLCVLYLCMCIKLYLLLLYVSE